MSFVKKRSRPLSVIIYILLIGVALCQIFPLIVLLINSFRTDAEIKNLPIGWPEAASIANYIETWAKGGYAIAFGNSFFIGAWVIVLVLIFAGLAAYGLSRLDIPFKSFFIAYFMFGMSFPAFLYIVPLYYQFSKIGLINNQLSLILIYSTSYISFSILLIRTYLISIPRALEEAGKIDGCSELGVLWHITVPLSLPILTTVALIVFVWSWNEFTWANTFISKDVFRTVSTRFYKFASEHTTDVAKTYTAGIITLSPIILIYLTLQKTFIEGLTQGSVKG